MPDRENPEETKRESSATLESLDAAIRQCPYRSTNCSVSCRSYSNTASSKCIRLDTEVAQLAVTKHMATMLQQAIEAGWHDRLGR